LIFVCCVCAAAAPKPIVKLSRCRVACATAFASRTNVYLPGEHPRHPAILVRTPYNKGADITPNYQAFVGPRLRVVVQVCARAATKARERFSR